MCVCGRREGGGGGREGGITGEVKGADGRFELQGCSSSRRWCAQGEGVGGDEDLLISPTRLPPPALPHLGVTPEIAPPTPEKKCLRKSGVSHLKT